MDQLICYKGNSFKFVIEESEFYQLNDALLWECLTFEDVFKKIQPYKNVNWKVYTQHLGTPWSNCLLIGTNNKNIFFNFCCTVAEQHFHMAKDTPHNIALRKKHTIAKCLAEFDERSDALTDVFDRMLKFRRVKSVDDVLPIIKHQLGDIGTDYTLRTIEKWTRECHQSWIDDFKSQCL